MNQTTPATDILTNAQKICADLSANIQTVYPNASLDFIFYNDNKSEALQKTLPRYKNQVVFEEAATILKFRTATSDESALLGIATGVQKSMLGIMHTTKYVGFIAINLKKSPNEWDLYFEIFRLTARFNEDLLNLIALKGQKESTVGKPKRDPLKISRSNLLSDIYAAIMLSKYLGAQSAPKIAYIRSMAIFAKRPRTHPEEYLFPMALDMTKHVIETHFADKSARQHKVDPFYISHKITSSFDDDTIRLWFSTVKASQNLSWLDWNPSQILGAQIYSSSNPLVKATGHLLAEVTNLAPITEEYLPQGYNPFLANEINLILHQKFTEQCFAKAHLEAMQNNNCLPFLKMANQQNDDLLNGHIMGWCAYALQAAAKSFNEAHLKGVAPLEAARVEFESAVKHYEWKNLVKINNHVISLFRGGEKSSFPEMIQWCGSIPEYKPFKESIINTLNDPNYTVKIDNEKLEGFETFAAGKRVAISGGRPSLNFEPDKPFYESEDFFAGVKKKSQDFDSDQDPPPK